MIGTSVKGSKAYEMFLQHIALPAHLRVSKHWADGRISTFFCNWLLPLLGIRWVRVEKFEEEGNPFYRFTLSVFFKKVSWVVRPVGAYYVGTLLMHLPLQSKRTIVIGDEEIGELTIPAWAHSEVLAKLAAIVMEERTHIFMVVDTIKEEAKREGLRQEEGDAALPQHTTH